MGHMAVLLSSWQVKGMPTRCAKYSCINVYKMHLVHEHRAHDSGKSVATAVVRSDNPSSSATGTLQLLLKQACYLACCLLTCSHSSLQLLLLCFFSYSIDTTQLLQTR